MGKKRTSLEAPNPPAPERSDSKAIVAAILEAARQLPIHASIQAIADRAGVGVASLYRYFPGREAIYAELGRGLHVRLVEVLRRELALTNTLEEAVDACIRVSKDLSFGERHVVEHVQAGLPSSWHHEAALDANREIVNLVADQLDRYVTAPVEARRYRAAMLTFILRGASRARILMQDAIPIDVEQEGSLKASLVAGALHGFIRREVPLPQPSQGSEAVLPVSES